MPFYYDITMRSCQCQNIYIIFYFLKKIVSESMFVSSGMRIFHLKLKCTFYAPDGTDLRWPSENKIAAVEFTSEH